VADHHQLVQLSDCLALVYYSAWEHWLGALLACSEDSSVALLADD
jgi:hypothetical protein